MKIPINWLNRYITLDESIDTLSSTLTLAGLEVDAITGIDFDFKGVVTAQVLKVAPHPNSKKLQIATVSTGKDNPIQVVCGADNCRTGLVTALAPIGAELKIREQVLTIEKGMIREIESNGMLCSKEELGLELQSDQILELPGNTPLGIPIEKLFYNPVFEISLTPNLGHCFSIYGVARELSYHFPVPLKPISFSPVPFSTDFFSISIESPDCEEFHLAVIENIPLIPSPRWLTSALESIGMSSIHFVVDLLNYFMHELGQPMHAYALDKLPSREMVIKPIPQETRWTGLDGITRDVPQGVLGVFNGDSLVAIAGVMGSLETLVEANTTAIAFECAHFSSRKVREAMKKLGFRTEAGAHFEKGIDRSQILTILKKVIGVVKEETHFSCSVFIDSVIALPLLSRHILLRPNRVNSLMGTELSFHEVEHFIKKIGCSIVTKTETVLNVEIPPYRHDLNIEVDLIEEVIRLYGFHHIEKSEGYFRLGTTRHCPIYEFENELRGFLIAMGLQETLSCNLISRAESLVGLSQDLTENQLISVLHAKSEDQSILRPSLIPSFIQTIKKNLRFQTKHLSFFEIGRVHFYDGEEPIEKTALGICLVGNKPSHFLDKGKAWSFFDLKGYLESLFRQLNLPITFTDSNLSTLHPGRQLGCTLDNEWVGMIGQLHPETLKAADLDLPVYFAQLDITELLHYRDNRKMMRALPEYPGSSRDVTLTIDHSVAYQKILETIYGTNPKFLKQVECLDLFRKDSIDQNLTLRLTYRSDERTLDFETVEEEHQQIVNQLKPLCSLNGHEKNS